MLFLYNQYALILMFLFWHGIFRFSFASTSGSNISIVTLNLANYDDHHHWSRRLQLIVRSLIAADADLIALQETRLNPDHPSSKRTYQNMASQVLNELNKHGAYIGAQLVTQPTMYYPTYISAYENTYNMVLQMFYSRKLPSPWKEDVSSMIIKGDNEGLRNYIRKEYAMKGMLPGGYVNPLAKAMLDPDYDNNKTLLWEGSSIISKRRILETGTLFMTSPHNCKDINQRATQYISVDLDSSDSYLSPEENNRRKNPNRFYLFNAHLGLEPACLISEVQDTTEYMNRMSGPSLLVGDFNAEPWHPAWDYFRKAGLTDLWQHLHPEHNDTISERDDNLATSTGHSIFDYVGEEIRDALEGNNRFDLEDAISDLEYAYGEEERIKECQFDGWCTFPSDKPYKRIDYAWANKKLTPFISSIDIIGNKSQIIKKKKKKYIYILLIITAI